MRGIQKMLLNFRNLVVQKLCVCKVKAVLAYVASIHSSNECSLTQINKVII